MRQFEIIDRLCGVTTMLADLVREQASIIAQADLPDETKEALAQRRKKADDELDALEYGMRHIHNSGTEMR